MKKLLLALLLVLPLSAAAQVFNQSQVITSPYGGVVVSPNTSGGTRLQALATTTPTVTAPITYSGILGSFIGGITGTFGCLVASGLQAGCLSSADWTTFNNKLSAALTSIGPAGQMTTGPAVTFASSTTGTDFTITGSGSAITFNLPTASASNRGLLSNTDWTTFNGKQAAGSYITALTGDVSAAGPGSAAATLATVNSSVGSFTNASITVNGKGLITAASNGTTGVGYPFPLAGNATSTLTQFNAGLTAFASSTIGDNTQGGSLTMVGNATTTGNSNSIVFNLGSGNAGQVPYPALVIENTNTTVNNLSTLFLSSRDTAGLSYGAQISAVFNGHSNGTERASLAFVTTDFNTGGPVERIRILSSGNTGVATTTPGSKFSVAGGVSIGTNYGAAAPTSGLIVQGNTGIGTTTPIGALSVQSTANTVFVAATSTGNEIGGYDGSGHRFTAGPPPAISSCGTGSGTVVGDDQSGTITTATAATACTATFSKAYANTPTCTVTDNSLVGFADISSISTTAVTFGISSALTGGLLYYDCRYHR